MNKKENINEYFEVLIVQILTIILFILTLLVILLPKPEQSKAIEIQNIEGKYSANGIVSVNCKTISPYSYGSTSFTIKNNTNCDLICQLQINQILENIQYDDFQMSYKIYSSNLQKTEQWLTPDQLLFEYILFESNSFETFYIDWCWTGENEYIDTNVGENGGHFWLTISIKEM